MKDILVPISPGELLDKITILRIKALRITNPAQVENVQRELSALERVWSHDVPSHPSLVECEKELSSVNMRLWDVEDQIRTHEVEQRFDAAFISLARAVYLNNDQRSKIKKRINLTLGSTLVEEKSHPC